MLNSDISPYFKKLAQDLWHAHDATPNHFIGLITDARFYLDEPFTSIEKLVDAVQRATRVMTLHHGGLLGNDEFAAAYDKHYFPLWSSHAPLKADPALQEGLANRLYNIDEQKTDTHASLIIGNGSNDIIRPIIERLRARSIPMQFEIADHDFTRLAVNHMDEQGLKNYAAYSISLSEKLTNRIIAVPSSNPPHTIEKDKEKHEAYAELIKPMRERVLSGAVMSTLTFFPTPIDAEIDGIPYQDYLKLFFELCDQPDAQIEKANDFLIEKLNKTTELRFTNDDGTDVRMSLVDHDGRHFTFANSQTRRNVPGSEVFSAPRVDSVNGVIVSKGKFLAIQDETKQVVNLTRHFEDGVMVSFTAEEGEEHFQEFLDLHPNHARVGEIGIGTNPHLKRHVANGLLVEKISSSFHTAQGDAYTMTDYLGTPVHMNNGNKARMHWDITTMLGDMYLDGECILKDGVFLPPELDVLNRGWNAVPAEERPDRWKDYKGPYTGPV
ncbi:MAG: leucyl aminopeptidase [Micavibrio aeruginosavorus]|uniref:Leucyl aminopeptidase n=1 Tax=Micavibrio aeruginosavorus TaxID=349221 RepID=A0A2W5N437_9BACT|nr:MAG: leucyl aminopeptidase [Micavibrio aeruginosavorus]